MANKKNSFLSELDDLPTPQKNTLASVPQASKKPNRKPFNHAIDIEAADYVKRVAYWHRLKENAALEFIINHFKDNYTFRDGENGKFPPIPDNL